MNPTDDSAHTLGGFFLWFLTICVHCRLHYIAGWDAEVVIIGCLLFFALVLQMFGWRLSPVN